jgi:hypothetical protein
LPPCTRAQFKDDSNVLRNDVWNDFFARKRRAQFAIFSETKSAFRLKPEESSYNREARSAFLAVAGGREGPWPQRHSFGLAFTAEICILPELSLFGIKRRCMWLEVGAQFSFGAPAADKLQSLVFLYVPIGF